jgi:hypothetical protein
MTSDGKMPWAQAVQGPLADVTCLWQDLDGLHVEPAPQAAPPTSVLWGWRPGTGYLVRLRLDGDTAYVAAHETSTIGPRENQGLKPTLPWSLDDGRIAASQSRGPSPAGGGVGATYEQIAIEDVTDAAVPITFFRPAQG